MKRHNFILLTCFLLLILCCNEKRNKISFRDDFEQVQETIKVISKLIKPFGEISYNFFDDRVLMKDSIKIGEINPNLIMHIRASKIYPDSEIRIFSALLFLKNNGIVSCFKYREFGNIFFSYRRPSDLNFDDMRWIILADDKIDTLRSFKRNFNEMDRKDNLILLSPIDRR